MKADLLEKTLSKKIKVFFDLLPRNGHGETRKSGGVEIHKTWLQKALAQCHPMRNAA